jgi:hypothetical protein
LLCGGGLARLGASNATITRACTATNTSKSMTSRGRSERLDTGMKAAAKAAIHPNGARYHIPLSFLFSLLNVPGAMRCPFLTIARPDRRVS